MADLETDREIEMGDGDETQEEIDSGGRGPSNFLYELNLIVTLLSLVSFSSEDGTIEDGKSDKDDEIKAVESSSCARKRNRDIIRDQKPLGKRSQRFQPMIKDSRHGRKM